MTGAPSCTHRAARSHTAASSSRTATAPVDARAAEDFHGPGRGVGDDGREQVDAPRERPAEPDRATVRGVQGTRRRGDQPSDSVRSGTAPESSTEACQRRP